MNHYIWLVFQYLLSFPDIPGDTGNRVGCTIFEREG